MLKGIFVLLIIFVVIGVLGNDDESSDSSEKQLAAKSSPEEIAENANLILKCTSDKGGASYILHEENGKTAKIIFSKSINGAVYPISYTESEKFYTYDKQYYSKISPGIRVNYIHLNRQSGEFAVSSDMLVANSEPVPLFHSYDCETASPSEFIAAEENYSDFLLKSEQAEKEKREKAESEQQF